MYTAPAALPRPSVAWPGHVLGLLSSSFLGWSLLVPWWIAGNTPSPPLGLHLPVGQFLLVAMGACLLGWIVIHILVGRPVLRGVIVVASLLLLLSSTLVGITWNNRHTGHAIPGLVWGMILGVSALVLADWSPVLVTRPDHQPGAVQNTSRAWSLQWLTVAILLLAGLFILIISIEVARDLRRPVVIPRPPCACIPDP